MASLAWLQVLTVPFYAWSEAACLAERAGYLDVLLGSQSSHLATNQTAGLEPLFCVPGLRVSPTMLTRSSAGGNAAAAGTGGVPPPPSSFSMGGIPPQQMNGTEAAYGGSRHGSSQGGSQAELYMGNQYGGDASVTSLRSSAERSRLGPPEPVRLLH